MKRPARAHSDRGVLHGLSLALLTVAIFATLAFFALGRFPLRCLCKDGTTQEGQRSGLDSPEKQCEQLCAKRGGGRPVMRGASRQAKSR